MTDDLKKTTPGAPIPRTDPQRQTMASPSSKYGAKFPEKPTVETAAIPAALAAMLTEIQENVKSGFSRLNMNQELTNAGIDELKDRVVIIERWKAESEERQRKHSGGLLAVTTGVGRISTSDENQNVQLSALTVRVGEVAQKLDTVDAKQKEAAVERAQTAIVVGEVKDAVVTFGKAHPALVSGAVGAATALLGWLASYFQAKGH